jgi:hypothetical protein
LKGSALLPVIIAGATPFLVLTLIVLGTGVQLIAWRPPVLWADQFGIFSDTLPTASGATAVAIDNVDLYVAGFENYVSRVQGSAFLARYDSGGHEIWTSTVSGNTSSALADAASPISGIAPWSNYLYIAANVNESSLIMKYDNAGNRVWISQFGGPQSEIAAISASANGVNVIGYHFDQRATLVQEYDFDGNRVWSVASNYSAALVDLKASISGVYVLTESNLLKYDQNGNLVWTRPNSCSSCAPGVALSEDSAGLYVAEDRGSVRKYATDGSVLWSTGFQLPDSSDSVQSFSISADSSGVYLYMEPYYSRSDFLAKYDPSGTQVWSFDAPRDGRGWEGYTPYISAGEGGVYLAGSTGREAIIKEFGGSSSLVFLGVNPPLSFITLGALIAIVVTGLVVLIRRSKREMRKRLKSVRRRGISETPTD